MSIGFRNGTEFKIKIVTILNNFGGLGDQICRLQAIKWLIKNEPHVKYNVYWPDYFKEIAEVVFKEDEKELKVKNRVFSDHSIYSFRANYSIDFNPVQVSSMRSHLVDHAFDVLCDYRPEDIESYNYVQLDLSNVSVEKFNLPERYVVITTGFTAPVREMLPEVVNGITEWLTIQGIKPVFLGKTETLLSPTHQHKIRGTFKEEIDFGKGINLIDQTSLLESAKIMDGALAVVGLDNGLLHLAGMTNATIVAGYSSVLPQERLPIRNNQLGYNCYVVVPDKELECAGCQTRMMFLFKHDFKFCYYDDYMCLKQMSADKYIKHLDEILNISKESL